MYAIHRAVHVRVWLINSYKNGKLVVEDTPDCAAWWQEDSVAFFSMSMEGECTDAQSDARIPSRMRSLRRD
jgi:hypothetical protein